MSPPDDAARWLRRPRDAGSAAVRLFCFHHAGGGVWLFRDWPRRLPDAIEPIAVQLPGRADRFREPPIRRMAPLVDRLAGIVAPLLDRPFAFFGLSLGARIAWALAHGLRDRGLPTPMALYLASAAAPGEPDRNTGWRDDLVGYLRSMGGTPPEVFAEPGLLETLLPTLRADLTLADTFRFGPATPLDVPIVAFAGRDDPEGAPDRMAGWRAETRGRFELLVRPGGHFFDPAEEARLIRTVADDLCELARLEPA